MSETPTPRLARLRAIALNADFIEAFARLSDLDIMRICAWRLLEAGNWAAAAHVARHRAAYFHPRLDPLPAAEHARPAAENPPVGLPLPSPDYYGPEPPRGEDPPGRDEIIRRAAADGVKRLYDRELDVLGNDQVLARAAETLRHDLGHTRIEAMLRGIPRDMLAAMESVEPGGPRDRHWVHPAWVSGDDDVLFNAMRDLLALRSVGAIPADPAPDHTPTPDHSLTTPQP